MNKTVKTVFMLIAVLVLIFLIWQLFFNQNGILVTGYNAVAKGINGQWEKIAGSGKKLLPEWGETSAKSNGKGFEIDTGAGGGGGTP